MTGHFFILSYKKWTYDASDSISDIQLNEERKGPALSNFKQLQSKV
jgi:hypothetical protein